MAIYFSDEAQTRAAHVVNFSSLSYTTRRQLSNNGTTEMMFADFGNYNKKESGSILAFTGYLYGKNDQADYSNVDVKIGASFDASSFVVSGGTRADQAAGTYTYVAANGSKLLMLCGQIDGYTTTGNSKVIATYKSGSGGGRPFALINPTSTDTAQINDSYVGSRINIWEILL
jgi:anaerobic selenocysteine-containing dehydrogenase